MKIYIIENLKSGKKYVGQTIQPLNRRMNCHWQYSKRSKAPLHVDMRKIGISNFSISEIETCDQRKADARESFYILERRTLIPHGYNQQCIGHPFKARKETRDRISKSLKGNKRLLGKKFPPGSRKRASGWKQTEEHKRNRVASFKKTWAKRQG